MANTREHVICCWMRFCSEQKPVNSGPLIGETLPVSLEGFTQHHFRFAVFDKGMHLRRPFQDRGAIVIVRTGAGSREIRPLHNIPE